MFIKTSATGLAILVLVSIIVGGYNPGDYIAGLPKPTEISMPEGAPGFFNDIQSRITDMANLTICMPFILPYLLFCMCLNIPVGSFVYGIRCCAGTAYGIFDWIEDSRGALENCILCSSLWFLVVYDFMTITIMSCFIPIFFCAIFVNLLIDSVGVLVEIYNTICSAIGLIATCILSLPTICGCISTGIIAIIGIILAIAGAMGIVIPECITGCMGIIAEIAALISEAIAALLASGTLLLSILPILSKCPQYCPDISKSLEPAEKCADDFIVFINRLFTHIGYISGQTLNLIKTYQQIIHGCCGIVMWGVLWARCILSLEYYIEWFYSLFLSLGGIETRGRELGSEGISAMIPTLNLNLT